MEPFSQAILTTDTCPKTACSSGVMTEGAFTIAGVAKGAGMIAPDMATMLCFIMTDADVSQDVLQNLLADAAGETFNMVTVDGDTSTNDSVIALCSGLGPALVSESDREVFADALREVCGSLARQIVTDGEGTTKVVEVVVNGADSHEEAKLAARSVAQSLLVKTALAAADPNWGRIAAAVGYSGVKVPPDKLSLRIGPVDILIKGELAVDYDEANAVRTMEESTYSMVISLGDGPGMASILTTDLTEEYVRINCEYRS
jgi:glutamate N-acetyltransferase/amino-acid N-acetyltransferase